MSAARYPPLVPELPKFAITIPVKTADWDQIQPTVDSILNQQAVIEHRALVDLKVVYSEISKSLCDWLESRSVSVTKEHVPSMYGALAQGLEGRRADYYGYLGVGDTYEPQAFDIVLENAPSASEQDRPFWITGFILGRREDGAIVRALLPASYRRRFMRVGLHGSLLPTLQAESTFWNDTLNSKVNLQRLAMFYLAGDFFLWRTFAEYTSPLIVEAALGSFRWHGDNMSADWSTYRQEMESITSPPSLSDRALATLDKGSWALPNQLKQRFGGKRVRRYRWPAGPWE